MKKLALALLIGGALFLGGCGNNTVTVGDLRYSHSTGRDEVYVVIRENGDEAYVLWYNVEECINTYKERGTYGKQVPQGKTL